MTNQYRINCLAIIQPLPGIGDMVVHASHIRAIAQHYQAKRTLLFTKKSSLAAEYADMLGVDEVIYLTSEGRKLRTDLTGQSRKDTQKNLRHTFGFVTGLSKTLKQHHVDCITVLHHSNKYAIAAQLAGIKKRFGYGYRWQKYFLTQSFHLPRNAIKKLYHSTRCDLFLQHMNIRSQALVPQLLLKSKSANTKTSIALGIGASGIDKQWGEKNFATLCQWIIANTTHQIVLCGGKPEQYISNEVYQAIDKQHHHRILSTCQLGIAPSMQLIAQADCYIGNDTGFLHVAIAFGKSSIGLFGSPYQAVLSYSPLITACETNLNSAEKASIPGYQHMQHITTSSVIDALKKLLKSKQHQHQAVSN